MLIEIEISSLACVAPVMKMAGFLTSYFCSPSIGVMDNDCTVYPSFGAVISSILISRPSKDLPMLETLAYFGYSAAIFSIKWFTSDKSKWLSPSFLESTLVTKSFSSVQDLRISARDFSLGSTTGAVAVVLVAEAA